MSVLVLNPPNPYENVGYHLSESDEPYVNIRKPNDMKQSHYSNLAEQRSPAQRSHTMVSQHVDTHSRSNTLRSMRTTSNKTDCRKISNQNSKDYSQALHRGISTQSSSMI
jgi:hypothetical protein